MIEYKNVSSFADKYDAFILDIWGVIHDGQNTYPDVEDCMKQLHAAGKKIIFLSNAPRRSHKVSSVLAKFGITANLYQDAVSSGEVAFELIRRNEKENSKFVYIGPEKDRDLLDKSGFVEVQNSENADFAVATGFDNDDSTLEEKLPQIESCLNNKLKMYCVNPDLIVVRQDKTSMLCAGVIGEYYRDNGGETVFIGKPYNEVYEKCFELLGDIPKEKIVAVGDNLDTDILGASQAGIDSILCLGGILTVNPQPLDELIKEVGVFPTGTIEKFSF